MCFLRGESINRQWILPTASIMPNVFPSRNVIYESRVLFSGLLRIIFGIAIIQGWHIVKRFEIWYCLLNLFHFLYLIHCNKPFVFIWSFCYANLYVWENYQFLLHGVCVCVFAMCVWCTYKIFQSSMRLTNNFIVSSLEEYIYQTVSARYNFPL